MYFENSINIDIEVAPVPLFGDIAGLYLVPTLIDSDPLFLLFLQITGQWRLYSSIFICQLRRAFPLSEN